jgi:hypothetical protein
VRRQRGGRAIETVSWQGSRGIVARVYDKSTEALSGPRGTLLRFEDQRRWPSSSRRDLDELTATAVREIFCRRFQPLWRASRGVTVVSSTNAARRLAEAVEREVITAGQAVDAAGHLMLARAGVQLGHRSTRYRHRRIAESLGLVLADGSADDVEVDLNEVLEGVMGTDAWGAQG